MSCLTKPLQVLQKLLSCRANCRFQQVTSKLSFQMTLPFQMKAQLGYRRAFQAGPFWAAQIAAEFSGVLQKQTSICHGTTQSALQLLVLVDICVHKTHSPFTPDQQDSRLKICPSIKLTMTKSKISDMVSRSLMFISSKTVRLDCVYRAWGFSYCFAVRCRQQLCLLSRH